MQRISRGAGFRGVLEYAFERDGEREGLLIGGSMSGRNPRELAHEFAAVRRLRPDIQKPVWHNALRLPAGEKIALDKWTAIADDYMQRMGFAPDHPRVYVLHDDPEGQHVHIIASRVSLSGNVYLGQNENLKSTQYISELERAYGLHITRSVDDARREQTAGLRRALKKGEIEMAIRTGREPPRQKLQRIIDELLKSGPISAPDFADALSAAGVSVRANIASTGKMNGFSFEVDGVAFKGSDLGKAYTWKGLLDRGVTYEQARDRPGLERCRPAAADRDSSARDAAIYAGVAGRDSPDRSPAADPSREYGLEAGRGLGSAAQGDRSVDVGDGIERDGIDARASASIEQAPNATAAASANTVEQRAASSLGAGQDPVLAEQDPVSGGQHGSGSDTDARSSERSAPPPVAPVVGVDSGRGSGCGAGRDWASRFKQASAAKRRAARGGVGDRPMEQGNTAGARVAAADRAAARELDPTAYLEASGYTVKREGRHLSVRFQGDEVYRVTRQNDRWLWCDHYGNTGGDNIDLVRDIEPGTGYAEAVYKLLGQPTVSRQPAQQPAPRTPPKLPRESFGDRAAGREYLRKRGISAETIAHAEKAGMLCYASGAVLFVGRDEKGSVQNVTRRAIDPADAVQKRDLRGSDKSYPPILPGDPAVVWIVEGGADALALHDIAKRSGKQPPTVIVSGGAHVRSFLEREGVQAILKRAQQEVVVAGENEKNIEVQTRTDAGHQLQAQRVAEITGREVRVWTPKPEQGKDLADMNARQVAQAEQRNQIEQRKQQSASRGLGLDLSP